MKAHRLQRNFSEGERPKRANSLTNVNARIFYLQGNWFEIHSIIYTWVIAKKAVSYALKSPELQRFNAIISWKTHQGSVLIIFLKVSEVQFRVWHGQWINSLKTHFYYVYTTCRIDEHVDMKNTPAWYEHLSCSYCYQEDPSKSAVA